jgi:YfiH family protein
MVPKTALETNVPPGPALYHWVARDTEELPMAIIKVGMEIAVGPERAVEIVAPGARVLFGIGPAQGTSDPRNRTARLLANLAPAVTALRWCHQVHETTVVSIAGEDAAGVACVGDCDALVTLESGVALLVWTADCVPVILVGRRFVAAAHVGWRGAAHGILPATLDRCRDLSREQPDGYDAYLGPAISGYHYPVGREVIDALHSQGIAHEVWLADDRVDLRSFAAAQLESLGVGRVAVVGGCTVSDPRLASYRRDGTAAGRQWSLVHRQQLTA